MARMIDADYLMERLNKKKAGPANKRYTEGFNDCLMRVRSMVHSMPTLTPPNEPLTIEQLREMGGQPVYMPDTNCWALVTQNAFCPILTFPDGEKCSVYDWYEQVGPVYRRPPEGEESDVNRG